MSTGTVLCFLGPKNYSVADYAFPNEETWRTRFFPLALAQHLGFGNIVLFAPQQVREHSAFDAFTSEVHGLGLALEVVPIPLGRTQEEVWQLFRLLVEAVPREGPVVYDITLGLRPLPFLVFMGISYLRVVSGVEIDGVYYGPYEIGACGDETGIRRVPAMEVSAAVDLVDWLVGYHAFREYGQADGLTEQLESIHQRLWVSGLGRPKQLKPFAGSLQSISDALLAIRWKETLERVEHLATEWAANTERGAVLRREVSKHTPPLAPLLDEIISSFRSFLPSTQDTGEERVSSAFSTAQVAEQFRLIRWYNRHMYVPHAYALMRELIITRLVALSGQDILAREARIRLEHGLNQLALRARDADNEAHPIIDLWQKIRDFRNDVMHAGMNPQPSTISKLVSNLPECIEELEELHEDCHLWSELLAATQALTFRKGEEAVLVSGLGTTPGALFTALTLLSPDRAHIITSCEGRALLPEIVSRVQFESDLHEHIVKEPFTGFDEADAVLEAMLTIEQNRGIGTAYVNLTGGTTVLQFIVDRIGERISGSGIPTCVVAMIDRRSSEEQRRRPYVVGKCQVLIDRNELE